MNFSFPGNCQKLYNNGCNTLMQYLMTMNYQLFVLYVKTYFLNELYTTLRSPYGMSRPSVSVSVMLLRPIPIGLTFSAIFLQHLIA